MKTKYPLFVLLLSSVVLAQSCGRDEGGDYGSIPIAQAASSSCICEPQRARDVGHLLLRSNPINEIDPQKRQQFEQLIRENAAILQSNGPTMICAVKLGNALQQYGLSNFNKQDYDRARGSVLAQGGTIDMADDVAGGMQQGAVDAWSTGRELVWLSQTLPAAAKGNWAPYWQTGTDTRNQLRQALAILGQMPELAALGDLINLYQPQIAEQMVMAACLYK